MEEASALQVFCPLPRVLIPSADDHHHPLQKMKKIRDSLLAHLLHYWYDCKSNWFKFYLIKQLEPKTIEETM